MIKVENAKVYNIARAIYSARNAMNSWDKSDSDLDNDILGANDLDLAKRLYKASLDGNNAHRKYLRQIFVSMDITAPLYWWKEADTYKVGTVTNSCSTMHKIHAKEFTLDDFSHEHLIASAGKHGGTLDILDNVIAELNYWRERYLKTNNKDHWWQMIQLLPTSYNQRRTVTMNYENVVTIIKQRSGHKLDEWNIFVECLKELPYIREIMGE